MATARTNVGVSQNRKFALKRVAADPINMAIARITKKTSLGLRGGRAATKRLAPILTALAKTPKQARRSRPEATTLRKLDAARPELADALAIQFLHKTSWVSETNKA